MPGDPIPDQAPSVIREADKLNASLHFGFAAPRNFAPCLDPVGRMRQLETNMRQTAVVQGNGAMNRKPPFAEIQNDTAIVATEVDIGEGSHFTAGIKAPIVLRRVFRGLRRFS